MQTFKKIYVLSMNAKFYFGLYFAAIVFLSGILTALLGGSSLRLLTLLQMFAVSMIITVLQLFLLPDHLDVSRGIFFGRSIVWLLLSSALTAGTAFWGNWFPDMPLWCSWLLGLLMLIGCVAMLIGIRLEQDADTVHLNEALANYQDRKSES